jgi:branched-chain amino acid aminotransferase
MMESAVRPTYLMFDGELIAYGDAKLHVLSPALKYGIAVFEGFCGYWNQEHQELYTFRMRDHLRRLRASLDMAGLDYPGDVATLEADIHRLIATNEFREDIHMRLQVFLVSDDGKPEDSGPTTTSISAVPVSSYFGRSMLNLGVSTWARISDRSMPPRMKSIANYHNGRQASIEARRNGYDAPLMLTDAGRISEGFGYNVFLVRDGKLLTPAVTESILEGITRDSVIRLASERLGLRVEERPIDRTELYSADEVFVCGSGEGVTGVASVDRYSYSGGQLGEVTNEVRHLYLAAARGEAVASWNWVSPVYGQSVVQQVGVG